MRTANAGIEGFNPIGGTVTAGMDNELRQIVDRLRQDRRLQHLNREDLAVLVSNELSQWATNQDWFNLVLQTLYSLSADGEE